MKEVIEGKLATHGLGEVSYPMDPKLLRTGEVLDGTDFTIVDCRDMLDEQNPTNVYGDKIQEAVKLMDEGKKVVICCGAGISRSNSIALGVLVRKYEMSFDDAWKMVEEKVPHAQIEPGHIFGLKRLFNVKSTFAGRELN